ncbi:MAG: hypothetical protein IIZ95_09170 [Erysipelotrichaceae bacterium]|nr:hypothetical protein [Erysipelotrichaceae bacterium]
MTLILLPIFYRGGAAKANRLPDTDHCRIFVRDCPIISAQFERVRLRQSS